NLDIEKGSTFTATGGGAGIYAISGNLRNAGTIDMVDGLTGDRLTVGGDYTGLDNALRVDTYLGDDSSPTDLVFVGGDTMGTMDLFVNSTDPAAPGAQTDKGIRVVDVGGASNGVFKLENPNSTLAATGEDSITQGAYAYALRKGGGGDWYLQSELLAGPVDPVDPVPTFNQGAVFTRPMRRTCSPSRDCRACVSVPAIAPGRCRRHRSALRMGRDGRMPGMRRPASRRAACGRAPRARPPISCRK
ncbi:autotransporter outer membrane beta-barrel domain-containing protein, partial [Sinorhizobium medicae]